MEFKDKADVGSWGEQQARDYLVKKGYCILETNWHDSHREIDIIASQGDEIVIVEVKTRTSTFLNPADAVNKQKQKLLIAAANYYVRKNNIDKNVRFDIISIVAINGEIHIEHIENAFYPLLR